MALSQVLFLLNQNIENKILDNSNPRFKVTSFDICGSYIVLGSNSGTLYFLNCNSLAIEQKISTQNGRIIQICVAPDEAYLAYATSSGIVYVIKIPGLIPSTSLHPVISKEHECSTVTALTWSQTGQDIYIGDNFGYLSLLHVPSNLATSLLLNLTHYLLKLDSAIFQLDAQRHYLVVSTLTKSYICNTRLETFTPIGTKGRQGEFGGCFCQVTAWRNFDTADISESLELSHQMKRPLSPIHDSTEIECASEALTEELLSSELANEGDLTEESRLYHTDEKDGGKESISGQRPTLKMDSIHGLSDKSSLHSPQKQEMRVFCSRPGTRLWECCLDGKVIATHQFKKAMSISSAPVIMMSKDRAGKRPNPYSTKEDFRKPDVINSDLAAFKEVFRFYDEYIMTYSASGIYIIDPDSSKVLLWTPLVEGVKQMKVHGNTTLVLTPDGGLHKYQATTVDVAILALHANGLYELCADTCLKYSSIFRKSYLLKRFWKGIFYDLLYHIEDEVLIQKVDELRRGIVAYSSGKTNSGDCPPNEDTLSSYKQMVNAYTRPQFATNGVTMNSANKSYKANSHVSSASSSLSRESDFEKRTFEDTTSDHSEDELNHSPILSKTAQLLMQTSVGKVSGGVQDMVGNLASNLVSTITSSTKSLRETLSNPSSLQKTRHLILQSLDGSVVNGEQLASSSLQDLSKEREKLEYSKSEPVIIQVKPPKKARSRVIERTDFWTEREPKTKEVHTPILPNFLEQFAKTISTVTKSVLQNESKASVTDGLIQWMKEYLQTVRKLKEWNETKELSQETERDIFSSSEFTTLVKDSSIIFLACFQHHIVTRNDEPKDNLSTLPDSMQEIDDFYAKLIEEDASLIDYSFIMNEFDSLERHLFSHSWKALVNRITTREEGSCSNPQILPDIDFTRAQRVQYLRTLIESRDKDTFLTAAANFGNPSVLFDVFYFCSLGHQGGLEFASEVDLYDCLKIFLLKVSEHGNLGKLYVTHWTGCPQMQTEILSALLYQQGQVELSCGCGFPRPNAVTNDQIIYLMRAMLSLPVYEPGSVLNLLENVSFHTGICDIALRYNLKPVDSIVPYVIQSLHQSSINALFNYIHPTRYLWVLRLLTRMKGPDQSSIYCLKCSSTLHIQLPSKTWEGSQHTCVSKSSVSLSGGYALDCCHLQFQNPTQSIGLKESLIEQQSQDFICYSSLWQLVFGLMLERIGSAKCVQLLQELITLSPDLSIHKRLFVLIIVSCLAETKRSVLRWSAVQLFQLTSRSPFSFEVQSALDKSVMLKNSEDEISDDYHLSGNNPVKSWNAGDGHSFIQETYSASFLYEEKDTKEPLTPGGDMDSRPSSPDSFISCLSSGSSSRPSFLPQLEQTDTHSQHMGTNISGGHIAPLQQLATNRGIPRAGHHWGVKVELLNGVCHLCQLGLTLEVMVNAGGVTVFACGHAYHTVCLSQYGRTCVLCHGPNRNRRS